MTDDSTLEAALRDVYATLKHLLAAADEQYEAVVARDRLRLESVTRQQEQLSARLARAEAVRRSVLAGQDLSTVVSAANASARNQELHQAIAEAVKDLKARNARTSALLTKSISLTRQTLGFIQRLVTPANPVYGAHAQQCARQSLLLDGRA